MKLQAQVSSLEPSLRLRNLGIKQKSLFNLYQMVNGNWRIRLGKLDNEIHTNTCISAFTVAELGEILPYTAMGAYLMCFKGKEDWSCSYGVEKTCRASTEADARAQMLIYLIENKLVTV